MMPKSVPLIRVIKKISKAVDFTEFEELVWYARDNNTALLGLIIERTYFFARYLDSRRHNPKRLEKITERLDEGIDGHN